MSQQDKNLKYALKKFTDKGSNILSGTVSNIDESAYTCTVTTANGLVIESVQLKALRGAENGFVLIPKDGCWVHILDVGQPDHFLIAAEELEKVLVKIDDCLLKVDSAGYIIQKGKETLGACLNDLIKVINQITVSTSTGPSSTPINYTDLTDIQNRFNSFLK